MWCEDLLRVSCSGDSAPLDSVMKYKDPATMERNVFFNPEPCKVVCLRREARRCSKVTTTCTRVMCSIQKMIKASKQKALKGHNTQRERLYSPSTVAEEASHRSGRAVRRIAVFLATFFVLFRLRARLFVWRVRRERGGRKKKKSEREGETQILLTMSADPSFCLLPPRLPQCRHTDCSR